MSPYPIDDKLKRLGIALLICVPLIPSCIYLEEVLRDGFGDCEPYEADWEAALHQGGALLPTVPDTAQDYAMAMLLNTNAVNELFRRLDENEFPVLSESVDILGLTVTLSVQPDIPLLGIGGNASCPECFSAEFEFFNQVDIEGWVVPGGSGVIGVQMPVSLIPIDDHQTQFVAQFQSLAVTDLSVDFGDDSVNTFYGYYLEPVVTTLLTEYIQWRLEDQPIATFDSWAIGQGDVLLAPRGPYIFPEFDTLILAMQTNLDMDIATPIEEQLSLPSDADVGLVFRPELIVAMAKRMNYENVIPQGYDEDGNEQEGGPLRLTIESMTSDDLGLLRTESKLWFVEDICGTATMAASMDMTVSTSEFTFGVTDFEISEGEGIGLVLSENDWLISGMMNALLDTMRITVNYDQVFGGEAASQPGMAPVTFAINGRGVQLYFNFLPGF